MADNTSQQLQEPKQSPLLDLPIEIWSNIIDQATSAWAPREQDGDLGFYVPFPDSWLGTPWDEDLSEMVDIYFELATLGIESKRPGISAEVERSILRNLLHLDTERNRGPAIYEDYEIWDAYHQDLSWAIRTLKIAMSWYFSISDYENQQWVAAWTCPCCLRMVGSGVQILQHLEDRRCSTWPHCADVWKLAQSRMPTYDLPLDHTASDCKFTPQSLHQWIHHVRTTPCGEGVTPYLVNYLVEWVIISLFGQTLARYGHLTTMNQIRRERDRQQVLGKKRTEPWFTSVSSGRSKYHHTNATDVTYYSHSMGHPSPFAEQSHLVHSWVDQQRFKQA